MNIDQLLLRSRYPAGLWHYAPPAWLVHIARAFAIVGIVTYNWDLYMPLLSPEAHVTVHGMLSDLEVRGQGIGPTLSRLDLTAGLCFLVAVFLRGPGPTRAATVSWCGLVGYAACVTLGGLFPYTCAEGLDAACRRAEWRFELPFPHYLHIVSGIGEFATATAVILIARIVTSTSHDLFARALRVTAHTMLFAYPVLAISYLTDLGGSFIEAVFCLLFSTMLVLFLWAPPMSAATIAHEAELRAEFSERLSRVAAASRSGRGSSRGSRAR